VGIPVYHTPANKKTPSLERYDIRMVNGAIRSDSNVSPSRAIGSASRDYGHLDKSMPLNSFVQSSQPLFVIPAPWYATCKG
jgi:hypothetical protein